MAKTIPASRAAATRASNGDGRATTPGPNARSVRSGMIQPFGSIRKTPIALPDGSRLQSCRLLNEILADTLVLYALYKKHHWLVMGPTFYQLHLLFDKHAEEQQELADLLAERVQALGGVAVGDPRHVAELTTIERSPDGAEDVPDMIQRTLDAHETVIRKVRDGIDATEDGGDWGSNDLLMGDVLRTHELQVWFLSSHLVDTPLVEG